MALSTLQTPLERVRAAHIWTARWAVAWHRAALAVILAISAALECIGLSSEGFANSYYAAGVKSMLANWHAFFFVSFDASGFVSLDKPPLGFWIQAASAKLFGFSSWSLLAPQALAGVLAVALLYHLVARPFGPAAGLLAAAVLALTPISMVIDRNNTIDALLILTLLLAAWAVLAAARRASLPLLLLAATLVGLGFNIKMLQAYLVLPALAAVYLLGAPVRRRTRFRDLFLALLVLLAVSFVWIVAVDLVPAAQRPFISDSGTNSELSLVFGYNGLGRLTQALFPGLSSIHLLGSTIDLTIVPAFAPEIGNPGWLRLFSPAVGGQASWFLLPALVGLLAALPWVGRHWPLDERGRALVLWGGWLLVAGIFFSTGRFFHLYYLVMIGPPIAALAGIGFPALWRLYRQRAGGHWWQRIGAWLLPATLVATALVQIQLLHGYPRGSIWPVLLLGGGSLLAAAALAAALLHLEVQLGPGMTLGIRPRVAVAITAAALCGLLVAPAAWGIMAIAAGQGGAWLPQAGPSTGGAGGPGGFGSRSGGGRFGANGGRFSFTPGTGGTIPGGTGQAPAAPGGGTTGVAPGTTPGGPTNTGSAATRHHFGTGFPGGGGFGGGGGGSGGAMTYAGTQIPTLDAGLLRYLTVHQGKDTYLVATTTSSYASLFILQTTQPAMALGGYQGWDRILTPATLAKAVADGTVRFFYLPATHSSTFSGTGGAAGSGQTGAGATSNLSAVNDDLVTWVRAHCTVVSAQTYDGQTGGTAAGGPATFSGGMQLYDCAAQR